MTGAPTQDHITPEGYLPRIVDTQIEQYLRLFGAVEVSGTKWCGKTWSSLAHGRSVTYVDRGDNLQVCRADPSFALVGETPHVIDEWQRVPALWDTVRHAVDESSGRKGLWLLTGSSTPSTDETAHSGAGRIGRIRMHPMTLLESGDSTGATSLAALFDGKFEPSQCSTGIRELADLCCRGGWPGAINLGPDDAQVVVGEYVDAVLEQSITRLGGNPELARRLAISLARNLGQAASLQTLARDVYALANDELATDAQQREVSRLLGLMSCVFLVDEVSGWVPAARSPKRVRVKPKRYFADPSIAVSILGLSSQGLLSDWQTFGLVFENLCMRDLDVYARALPQVSGQPVRYYRDDSNLEVDAIIERRDGSWGAFEIKLSQEKVDAAAASLLRLEAKVCGNESARTHPASFLAVLVGVGEIAYRRPDGVYVIPICSLGA